MDEIPDALFSRLARLDQRCRLRIMSRFKGDVRLGWRVVVSCRDGDGSPEIEAEAATLIEALDLAVTRADAMGWLDP